MMHPYPLRRLIPFVLVVLMLPACSDSSDEVGSIAFEDVFDQPSETSAWTASGEAIDNGLLCPAATGTLEGFEGENGEARGPDEIGELYEAGELFVNVSVELMTCDDGSGEFTLRLINEIDPAISDGVPVVASTWTITGGSGYDSTAGDGDSELPQEDGASSAIKGTGIITRQ
jgi:hypothetical protein